MKFGQAPAVQNKHRVGDHEQRLSALAGHRGERRLELIRAAHREQLQLEDKRSPGHGEVLDRELLGRIARVR